MSTIAKVVPITAMVTSNFGQLSFELVFTMQDANSYNV